MPTKEATPKGLGSWPTALLVPQYWPIDLETHKWLPTVKYSPTLAFLKSSNSFCKTQHIQAPRQLARVAGLVPKDLIALPPLEPGPTWCCFTLPVLQDGHLLEPVTSMNILRKAPLRQVAILWLALWFRISWDTPDMLLFLSEVSVKTFTLPQFPKLVVECYYA